MTARIGDFISVWGEPTCRVEAPPDRIDQLRGWVPDAMHDYWQTFGFSGFADGLLWLCDPIQWQPAADAWTRDISLVMGADTWLPIARSAFGEMELWGQRTGLSLTVQPWSGMVFPVDNRDEMSSAADRDIQVESYFETSDPESLDVEDDEDVGMFASALSRLGPVGPDQVYAFIPALGLGGSRTAANLELEDGPTQLQLLADLTERVVMGDIKKTFYPDSGGA